jgi:flagellar protein FlgJ
MPSLPAGDTAKLSAASKQFEAILVRQMLAAARKASFGDALFGSEAGSTFREMQDNRFADVVAERGVLGLAAIIEAQIGKTLDVKPGGSS